MEKDNLPEVTGGSEKFEEHPIRLVCGFWRRLFAFIVDGILLGIFGIIIGTIFFDFFVGLGGWGRLIGFIIALLYFGVLNSSICHGQTIGKRILRIRVVDKGAKTISPIRSFTRFSLLGPPYFLNGALIPPNILINSFVSLLLGLVVFFMGGAIVYLYIFNRKTRQSLHDLVVGTFVIKSPVQKFSFPPLWKGHLAIVGLLFVTVTVLITVLAPKQSHREPFSELFSVQQSIQESDLVHVANVTVGKSFGTNVGSEGKERSESTYFLTKAVLKKRPDNYEVIINDIASIILEKHPQIDEKDALIINVTYGYDIGLASAYKSQKMQYSPQEWRERLSTHTKKYKPV